VAAVGLALAGASRINVRPTGVVTFGLMCAFPRFLAGHSTVGWHHTAHNEPMFDRPRTSRSAGLDQLLKDPDCVKYKAAERWPIIPDGGVPEGRRPRPETPGLWLDDGPATTTKLSGELLDWHMADDLLLSGQPPRRRSDRSVRISLGVL